jgi:hypothetical protein
LRTVARTAPTGVASWPVGFASSPLCGGLAMIVPYLFFLTEWTKSSTGRLDE